MRHFQLKQVSIAVVEWQPGVQIPDVMEGPDKSAFMHTPNGKVSVNRGDFVVVEVNGPLVQRVFSPEGLAARFEEVKTPSVKEATVESKPVEKAAVVKTKPVKKVVAKKAATKKTTSKKATSK